MSIGTSALLAEVKRSLEALRVGNEAEKRALSEAERQPSTCSAGSNPYGASPLPLHRNGLGPKRSSVDSAAERRFLEPEDGPNERAVAGDRAAVAGSSNVVLAQDGNSRERERLEVAESQLEKRRAALHLRKKKQSEQQEILLEVEASLVELRKEVDVMERSSAEKSRLQDAKEIELEKTEAELLARTLQLDDLARVHAEELERLTEELEEAWRRIEDQSAQDEQLNAQEQQRLRRQVSELESRDGVLRERQRGLTEREHGLNTRRRQLEGRKRLLDDIDRNSIERLKGELAERETLLQQALAAAGHHIGTPHHSQAGGTPRTPSLVSTQ